ncbi:MAG TPA: histidine kinase [Thermoanaerobaculia bacterium]|jgi:sensor histidine kinase YesM
MFRDMKFHWTPRRLLLNFAIWTTIAAILTVHLLLTDERHLPHHVLVMRATFNYWTCALLTPFVVAWTFRISATRLRARIPLHIAGYAVFHLIYSIVRTGLAHFDDPLPVTYSHGFLMVLAAYEFQNFWLYLAQVVAAQALVEFQRRTNAAADAAELALRLKDSELRALKMQLQPHFLFNTLHSIGILMERDPAMARTTMVRLSDLLRHSLQQRAGERLTLRSELEMLDKYVAIEKVRFQEKLDIRLDVAKEALDALVPALSLQPLVENAIRHARVASGPTRVTVSAAVHDSALTLTVEDNGNGFTHGAAAAGHGVGLKNLEARLLHLYNGCARLEAGSADAGARVAITLPFERWEGPDA